MVIKQPFLRTPYNYDMEAASDEAGLACRDQSLAVQSSLEETDINTIVRRFGLTGQLPTDVRMPQYEDFEAIFDYHSALTMVREAEAAFLKMPAAVRDRFNNDPQNLMAFMADGKNLEEARLLGLVVPPPEAPEPALVRVVPDVGGHSGAAGVGSPSGPKTS